MKQKLNRDNYQSDINTVCSLQRHIWKRDLSNKPNKDFTWYFPKDKTTVFMVDRFPYSPVKLLIYNNGNMKYSWSTAVSLTVQTCYIPKLNGGLHWTDLLGQIPFSQNLHVSAASALRHQLNHQLLCHLGSVYEQWAMRRAVRYPASISANSQHSRIKLYMNSTERIKMLFIYSWEMGTVTVTWGEVQCNA